MFMFFMEQIIVILDECGLCFRTAACMEDNYLSNPFSGLDTYIWLKIQYAPSQKGYKCKQSSHTLSCTSESYVQWFLFDSTMQYAGNGKGSPIHSSLCDDMKNIGH